MSTSFLNDCIILGQGKAGDALRLPITHRRISGLISQSIQSDVDGIPVFKNLEEWATAHPKSHRTINIGQTDSSQTLLSVSQRLTFHPKPSSIFPACTAQTATHHADCLHCDFHPNAVLNKGLPIPKNTTIGLDVDDPDLRRELESFAHSGPINGRFINVDRRPYHLA